MIQIREAVIVEGKYDKIKLSSIIDGLILETHGFQIFKDQEQMALLRKLAATRGLLVLTDSDGAGFVIRNYLRGCIPKEQIRHAYIPDLFGKEKRKKALPKKESWEWKGFLPVSFAKRWKKPVSASEKGNRLQKARRLPKRIYSPQGFPAEKAVQPVDWLFRKNWTFPNDSPPMDCCKSSMPP